MRASLSRVSFASVRGPIISSTVRELSCAEKASHVVGPPPGSRSAYVKLPAVTSLTSRKAASAAMRRGERIRKFLCTSAPFVYRRIINCKHTQVWPAAVWLEEASTWHHLQVITAQFEKTLEASPKKTQSSGDGTNAAIRRQAFAMHASNPGMQTGDWRDEQMRGA